MNKWVAESIKLANSKGYLDELFKVYPLGLGGIRDIPENTKKEIRRVFRSGNQISLIKELLKLPRFPIDDPYIASLRKHPFLLQNNPRTIKRINKRLFSMGVNNVLELAGKPKSPSRQFGHSFKKWLDNLKYPILEEQKFRKYNGVAFLSGGDRKLQSFAIQELNIKNLKKGIDFILKVKRKFILGEAKFLTDYGGTQNNQFRDAISIASIKKDNVIGVAVLDGIVWFKSNAYMHKTVKSLKGTALSALLLEKFIKEQL